MNSKRLTDALKQIPLQLLLLLVTGLIAEFAMIIPGLIVKAFVWFGNSLSAESVDGVGYLVVGIIGLIASVIAVYMFMNKPGVDGAIVAEMYDTANPNLNIIYPLLIVIVSVGVYFGICCIAGYQFIGGPVSYFAPFFARATGNTSFGDVPTSYKLISMVILVVCEIPAMIMGYIRGFKSRKSGKSLL